MFSTTGFSSRPTRPALVRTTLLGTFLLGLAALGNMACEDKAIGRPCDLQADAGQAQAVYNAQALECPSRICLKPVNVNTNAIDTGPYCSAECSKDSDCEGQKRSCDQNKDPSCSDYRCKSGYACGVAFVVGQLCCKKLCLCKDFLSKEGVSVPLTCDKSKNNGKTACAEESN